MQINTKNILVSATVVILVITLVFFVYKDKPANKTGEFTINQISTTTELKIDTSKNKSVVKAPVIPDLNRAVIADNIATDLRNQLTIQLKEKSDSLKNNPGILEEWVSLGSLRKIAGDYSGARLAWEYANAIRPLNYVSFSNLGDLCHLYLKDYPCAEKNLLISVKNEPTYIGGYRALYDLYTLSYKEKIADAPKILLRGLSANPQSVDLIILLAQYYRDTGDKAKALLYYDKAIILLTTAGDTAMLEAIKSDRSALTQ